MHIYRILYPSGVFSELIRYSGTPEDVEVMIWKQTGKKVRAVRVNVPTLHEYIAKKKAKEAR